MITHVILGSLWIAWCVLHSTLIATGITARLGVALGRNFRFFRLAYNLIALITLIPLLFHLRAFSGTPVFAYEGRWLVLRMALIAAAALFFLSGARSYDLRHFFGLRQVVADTFLAADRGLKVSGVLRVTRHPWYLGALLLIWAADLDTGTLVVNGVLSAYLVIGSYLEERKLIMEFGEEYRRYQRCVSMLFPYRYLRTKLEAVLAR